VNEDRTTVAYRERRNQLSQRNSKQNNSGVLGFKKRTDNNRGKFGRPINFFKNFVERKEKEQKQFGHEIKPLGLLLDVWLGADATWHILKKSDIAEIL
jgi:hypothetical protein